MSEKRKQANILTPEQAAYVAGFVDAEGWLGGYLNDGLICAVVQVSNTNRFVLDYLKNLVGVGSISRFPHKNKRAKPVFAWRVSTCSVHSVLSQITPFLRCKLDQAGLLSILVDRKYPMCYEHPSQMEILKKLRCLNFRGSGGAQLAHVPKPEAKRPRYRKQAKTLSPTEAAYLAGVVDGDGCFYAGVNRASLDASITVTGTNKDFTLSLIEITGIGSWCAKRQRNRNAKVCYSWAASTCTLASLIPQIMPYLFIKKEQAELVYRLAAREYPCRLDSDWQIRSIDSLRVLNHRGLQTEEMAINN